MICILVLLPLNALVSRARDFHDQTCAADSVDMDEPHGRPVLALGPGARPERCRGITGLFWSALRPVCGVPSQSDGFFLCPVFLKHTRLIDRIPRKVLLANLGPVRRYEVGPRAVYMVQLQGATSFCQARLRFLSRGNVEKSKSGFFTMFRVKPPTTHDRGIFTCPG